MLTSQAHTQLSIESSHHWKQCRQCAVSCTYWVPAAKHIAEWHMHARDGNRAHHVIYEDPATRRTVLAASAASRRDTASWGSSSLGRPCMQKAAMHPVDPPAARTGALGANARHDMAVSSAAACAAAGRCTESAMSQTCAE